MKKTTLFICLFMFGAIFAQNTPIIKEVIGIDSYEKLERENPGLLTFYHNFLQHGVILINDFPTDKNVTFSTLTQLKYRDKNKIENPTIEEFKADLLKDKTLLFKYNIFPQKEAQFFKIEGTNIVLHILSIDQINQLNKA